MLCPECGCSEPLRSYKAGRRHQRLRPFGGTKECENTQVWANKPLAYGHQFQSYCLVARPVKSPASVESLAYALQRGLCTSLDLELNDIGVSWRWLSDAKNKTSSEIILYDQTPGGAGFVKEAFNNWDKVIVASKKICEGCTCEHACYDCLKSYNNQSQHEKLNRFEVSF